MGFDAAYEAKIDELQKWFQENPKLPNEIDRLLLRRFYHCMDEDMDATKKLIKVNYSLRNKNKSLFIKRDPNDENSRKVFEYADMVPLPGLTNEKYKISLYRLSDYDHHKMNHNEDTKGFFMVADCRFVMPDVNGEDILSEGEIQIFDMTGYTMKHVTKLTISTLRVYMKFLQEALPVRLKGVHMINCPPYLDKILTVFKPLISKEVFKMMHFHTQGIESLYEHVPRDMLPLEYGGKAGKISDLKSQWMQILYEKRDYLMDLKHWKKPKQDN